MQSPPKIFDRAHVRRNRTKLAKFGHQAPRIRQHATEQVIDRLNDVTRSFTSALACGVGTHELAHRFSTQHSITTVVRGEFCSSPLKDAVPFAVYDDEWVPFKDGAFDLVVNALSLHWVNDLPGALIQLRRCLRPDGLFLATLFGGQTLHELRDCLLEAETQLKGGASPRVSPFVDVRDAGDLLVRAGLALPVADTDVIEIEYETLAHLFADLRAMGETNAVHERTRGLTTAHMLSTAESIYRDRHQTKSGRLKATFELVTLTGWAPADTQQKPLTPGAATHRLSDALDTDEQPL